MKILLVGEFSGFHLNLKHGLEKFGYHVVLASSGDAWKKIDSDINIRTNKKGIYGKIYNLYYQYKIISQLKNFDVVQFMTPLIFSRKFSLNNILINKLIANNKKSFLLASGSDSFYWKNYKEKFRYSPHDDYRAIDNKGKELEFQTKKIFDFNYRLAKKVDGIIPIMYDYSIGYSDFDNKTEIIPIPLNLEDIAYTKNVVENKIVIFHGLNREGFKGTKYIKAAMKRLKKKHPDKVEIVIKGKIPLKEYLNLMKRTNIVIDQALTYSYGVNTVMALAMGKIVLSGCEPECLDSFNIESSPIINIMPSENDIFNKLERLILDEKSFEKKGMESRKYAEKIHDSETIAKKFVDTWTCT